MGVCENVPDGTCDGEDDDKTLDIGSCRPMGLKIEDFKTINFAVNIFGNQER